MIGQQKKIINIIKKMLPSSGNSQLPISFYREKLDSAKCQSCQVRLISFVVVFNLSSGDASATSTEEKTLFNLPRQRADISLINFAEQADITLLLPLDKIEGKTTNPLIGRHSILNALQILLKDTGLKTKIDKNGNLSILVDPNYNPLNIRNNKEKSSTPTPVDSPMANKKIHDEVEVIEISGIRSALIRAMDAKRESNGVVDSISAEDIGKFPDSNLAESLQRIAGVSIDRTGGEGQLITVRGFGPKFNTVLMNGRQIASENQSRAFSFDTLASELVDSLDVHKTSTAAMQSGGIGATVNVNTARPFAINGFKVAGSIKNVHDENSRELAPQASFLMSNTFDEKFGLLVSLSHQERQTRLNQAQVDGWLENVGVPNPQDRNGQPYSGNIFSPRNYDFKVTTEQRTRTNANLVIQYAPSDTSTITIDGLYSDFDVETDTTSYGHWFTAPNLEGFGNDAGATVDENGTVVDLYQEVGLATDMHAKKFDRLTNSNAVGINLDWRINDNLSMTFDLSQSNAEREANNGRGDLLSLVGYANRARFQIDNNILPYVSEFSSANANIYSGQQELDEVAYITNVTPAGVENHLDVSNSKAHVMLRRGWAIKDNVNQFRWDSTLVIDGNNDLAAVNFGAMYSSETKNLDRWDNERSGIHCTFCGYPDSPNMSGLSQYIFDAGSDFLGNVSGGHRMPTLWLAHDGEENFTYLQNIAIANGEPISFDAEKRNKSFEITEDIFSTYAELDFEMELDGMTLSASAGLRYELTDVDVKGTDEPITDLMILDKTEMLATYGSANSISKSAHYSAILPNLRAKLEINDEVIARFAASRTITRPPLDSMSPVTIIGTTRQGGNLTASSGNPALKPFTSNNLDISLEWYYGDTSYMSAGFFIKNVANFITNSTEDLTFKLADNSVLTDPSTGSDVNNPDSNDVPAVFTNTLPNISESARVAGWELALQHSFNSGLGLIVNATIVDSDTNLDPTDLTQIFALTGLSDSYNVIGYYEKGPFQMRIAYNWRDSFVQSLTQPNGDGVTIFENYAQVDASGSFALNDNISFFFEGINLTEEYVHKRGRFANQLLLVEDSGRRFAVGIRGSY